VRCGQQGHPHWLVYRGALVPLCCSCLDVVGATLCAQVTEGCERLVGAPEQARQRNHHVLVVGEQPTRPELPQ
jgi:hypothetical protein